MNWKELGVLNGIQSDRHWQVIWLVTPLTNVDPSVVLVREDYGLKASITAGVSRVRDEPERFDWTLEGRLTSSAWD